jgi:hypothetical protein
VAIRPALVEQRARQLDEEAAIFATVLRDGIMLKEFREVQVDATAHAFLDATNSLLPYYLSAPELRAAGPVQHRVLELATLLVSGVRIKGRAG